MSSLSDQAKLICKQLVQSGFLTELQNALDLMHFEEFKHTESIEDIIKLQDRTKAVSLIINYIISEAEK